jgi:serine phosphatase RsbU (regulator of sigma subunit)/methanogenic corrinoid protein MtbC1
MRRRETDTYIPRQASVAAVPEVATLRDEYVTALVEPDARRARTLITEALASGTDPESLYLDVLAPALYEIGLRWERGELGIAAEHLASSVTESAMAELAGRMRRESPARGPAVVACVGEELHRIGSRVVADFLEGAGWDVEHLGAMVPVEHLVAAAEGASLVALSITLPSRVPELVRACEELHALDPAPFVAAGGQGLTGSAIPADLVTNDPRELVRRADAIPAGPGRAFRAGGRRADLYAEESTLVQEVLRLNDDLVRARREISRQRDELAQVAATLQRSLLPDRLPQVTGLQMAHRYLPGTTADVGGDFYDAFLLPGGDLALAIGDVAGKGVAAAAIMGEVRTAIRAYALDESDPALVLGATNRLVERAGHMVTALLAFLDPRSGSLRFASAGHPPPLLLPADGSARYLEGGRGAPLVIYASAGTGEAQLRPGDRVALFTDGLVERRDTPLDVSLERLRAVPAEPDPEQLCDALLATAPTGQARDDVALLVAGLSP